MANETITKHEWQNGINILITNLKKNQGNKVTIDEKAPNYPLLCWLLGFKFQLENRYKIISMGRAFYKPYEIRATQVKDLLTFIEDAIRLFEQDNTKLDYDLQLTLLKHVYSISKLLVPNIKNGYKKSFLRKIVLEAQNQYLFTLKEWETHSQAAQYKEVRDTLINSKGLMLESPSKIIPKLEKELSDTRSALSEIQHILTEANQKNDIQQKTIISLRATIFLLGCEKERLGLKIDQLEDFQRKILASWDNKDEISKIMLELKDMITESTIAETQEQNTKLTNVNEAFSQLAQKQTKIIEDYRTECERLKNETEKFRKERDEQADIAKKLQESHASLKSLIQHTEQRLQEKEIAFKKQAKALEEEKGKSQALTEGLDKLSKAHEFLKQLYQYLLKIVQKRLNHPEITDENLQKEFSQNQARQRSLTSASNPIINIH